MFQPICAAFHRCTVHSRLNHIRLGNVTSRATIRHGEPADVYWRCHDIKSRLKPPLTAIHHFQMNMTKFAIRGICPRLLQVAGVLLENCFAKIIVAIASTLNTCLAISLWAHKGGRNLES